MNLLIGFVVILCLIVCEFNSQTPVEDVWTRTFATLFIAACVPALAILQTFILSRRAKKTNLSPAQRQSSLNRLIVCHGAVWLAASLMIVCSIRWQIVVRQNWGLDRWPLVDELLILLPILASLLASWWIFCDIGHLAERKSAGHSWVGHILDSKRLTFITVRFRVHAALTLLPIAIFVFMRDLTRLSENFPTVSAMGAVSATLLVFLGYPFLISIIWNLKPIAEPELKETLERFCRQHRLRVFGVRVWNTDNQILNAMVAGFVPGFRMIILTDAMLSRFPREELFAILRHEAGHIRLWHLPIRASFVLLPLLVLAVGEYLGVSVGDRLNAGLAIAGIMMPHPWLAPSIVYLAYLALALGWLSRKMEFEADLYAATHATTGTALDEAVLVRSSANELLDALLRLACYFPKHCYRPTLLHPSLSDRMKRIAQLRDGTANRERLTRVWQHQQAFLLVLLLVLCMAAVIV